MKAIDVKNTTDKALFTVELPENRPPKLLPDNGSCYILNELAAYLQEKNIHHARGRPLHPKTQGKIERYHRSMKNVVKLDNYFSPGQLEVKMEEFVKYYNFQRYHESLENLNPSDVYFRNGQKKLKQRKLIKKSSKKIN
jgi:putative transposase